MSIRSVIDRLGGISAVARELNHKNVTTVQGWCERDILHPRRQREVLDLADRLNVAVDPLELIPASTEAE
ncbi:carph-isopro domain-containing protein [Sphingobium rhizovicinum]|uniref:Carph-isopro domain-containing protein n=1 Tax=Sphingobium rhizovicinum TaxID=432308 RepID=A0ABV7NJ82_9SPHN